MGSIKWPILGIILFLLSSCSTGNHWKYFGVDSPDDWGKITSEFKSCELGHHQSPIDLVSSEAEELPEKIEFSYHDSRTRLIDNGHTIKAEFQEENFILIGVEKFYLDQLHFHAHSEHSIDGIFYPIEMHLVHKSNSGKLAVLAFFVDINGEEMNRFGFFKNIKEGSVAETTIKLSRLLDHAGAHFYYEGSLTTPPCTEGVHWVIFDKHIKLHRSQIEKFKAIYTRNFRPIKHNAYKDKLYHSSI